MTPLDDVISAWPYVGDAANQFCWRSWLRDGGARLEHPLHLPVHSSRPYLGHHRERNAVTGPRVHRRPERIETQLG